MKPLSTSYPVTPQIMRKYEAVVKALVDPITSDQEKGRGRSDLMDLDGTFVYFQADGREVTSFGKNRRYKWVREYSTAELLERIHPDFLPCTSRQRLCLCCRLFGMVGEGENQQVAGRVMFEDALIQRPYPPLQQHVVLRILGGPKPKYHPFYVTAERRRQPKGLAGYDDADAHLRGRKFYWHHPPESRYYREPNQQLSSQNVQVELLPAGATFTFKVDFTNLEDVELGLLLYSLCLNDNDPDGMLGHKLGMGKPLGLGSVKITITDVHVQREADRWRPSSSTPSNDVGHYIGLFQTHLQRENNDRPFDRIPNIADLNDILSTQALTAPVEYPPPYDEGFRWFMDEKRQGYPHPLPCVEQTRDGGQTLQSHQTQRRRRRP